MDEEVAFEIDARMVDVGGSSATSEEHEVTWLQVFAVDGMAILLVLFATVALELDTIDITIDVAGEARAIHPTPAVASIAVRRAHPAGRLDVEAIRVVFLDVETEDDTCTCQLTHLVRNPTCAMTRGTTRSEDE